MKRENLGRANEIDDELVDVESEVEWLEKITDVSAGSIKLWHGSGVLEIALTDDEMEAFWNTVTANRKYHILELKAELEKL